MKSKLKIFLVVEYSIFCIFFICFYQFQRFKIAPFEVIFFMLVLFLTSNLSLIVNTGRDILTSINLPILISGMALLGPFWTGMVALIGTIKLRQIKNDFIWYQFIFNKTLLFLAAGIAALVFQFSSNYFTSNHLIVPFFLAALTYFIINNGLVYLVVRIASEKKEDSSLLFYYFQLFKNLISSYFLGLIFYYSYLAFGKLFLILAIIFIYIIKDFLFSRIQQLNGFTQIIGVFLKVIDSKDHYTEGHCERVALYTYFLCQKMGLNKGKIEQIVNMAKIHDIGKIYIDDEILKSTDLLTKVEYEEMKKHSSYGYQLLKDIDFFKPDLKIILYHHERYDGTGYPEGKKGKEIPLGARIISICDAFDVMTTGRSYKVAMNKNQVIQELKDCSGEQFDPKIAMTMISLIDEGKFDDRFKDRIKDDNKELELSLIFN